MPELSNILLFMTAAFALLIVPGPAVLYVVTRSIDQGRLAGIVSVAGIATGSLVHIFAAAVGLSALLMSSALVFQVVKYLGAAYLIYLGIRKLLEKEPLLPEGEFEASVDLWRIFRQGFIVNTLNPKSALFFFAFLPQFIDPSRGSATLQILFFGAIFVVMAFISDGIYALLAGTFGTWLKKSPRFLQLQRFVTGGIYIALGLITATASGTSSSGEGS